jgi:signal transduction histidine kinase
MLESSEIYAIAFIISTAITAMVSVWSYSKRDTRAALLFSFVGLTATIWGLFEVLKVSFPFSPLVYYFHLGTLIAGFFLPFIWLIFVFEFAGWEKYARGKSAKLTIGLGGVLAFISALDPLHHLLISVQRRGSEALVYTTEISGPLYIVNVLLVQTVSVFSFFVLIHLAWTSSERLRNSSLILLVGILLVWITNILAQVEIGILEWVSHTALSFPLFAVFSAYSLVRHDFLNITPKTHTEALREVEKPVLILNNSFEVVEANPFGREIFGEQVVGLQLSEISTELGEQVKNSEKSINISTNHGGQVKHYNVSQTSIKSRSGETYRYSLFFSDVTELKESTERLNQKNKKLERFASTVSHDLRNPLTIADMYNKEVLRKLTEKESKLDDEIFNELKSDAKEVEKSTERMDEMIGNLLERARSGDGVEITSNNFEETAQESWEQVETKDMSLRIESGGIVYADSSGLKTCLENLFRNSVEHAKDGTTVTLRLESSGFCVADIGPGFSKEVRDEAFDYGVTEKGSGTGIGLSTIEDIAETHGWDVQIDKTYEEGAKIDFEDVGVEKSSIHTDFSSTSPTAIKSVRFGSR